MSDPKYYSQNDEEEFILNFFGQHIGRFLDIGAFNGIDMSNTRRLLERGWNGVLVEPMWTSFDLLCKNCDRFKDKVKLVCAAASYQRRLAKLWVDTSPGRTWSTTVNNDLLKLGSVISPSSLETFVACITMDDLWPFGPFDFISMDSEWEDFQILKSQPAEAWRSAGLICIEKRGPEEGAKMKEHFAQIGFYVGYETKENLLVHRKL